MEFLRRRRRPRDMGQNHLWQMLSLVAMDHPISFGADKIREKRDELLRCLIPPSQLKFWNIPFVLAPDTARLLV